MTKKTLITLGCLLLLSFGAGCRDSIETDRSSLLDVVGLVDFVGDLSDATPPSVVSTMPADGDTGVGGDVVISAVFDEAMDPDTITAGSFIVLQGAVPVGGTVSYAGDTAMFTPAAPLTDDTVFTAVVTTDATDLRGNNLAGNVSWSFTTGYTVPAGLAYSDPAPIYGSGIPITPNVPTVTGSITAWAVTPALPAGLVLDTATGIISGTPTVEQAATPYTVTATNPAGSASTTLSITIAPPPPSGLSYAAMPAVYIKDAAITPAVPSVTGTVDSWSVVPALPAGLIFNTATGEISGTPTAWSPATNYTVTAYNSGGSASVTISIRVRYAAPTAFSYADMTPAYTQNSAITPNTVTPAVPAFGEGLVFTGVLPPGLSLDPATGEITGTPTVRSAAADYTITATNDGGSVSATVNIRVLYAPPTAFSYTDMTPVYTQNSPITPNTVTPAVPGFGEGLLFSGFLPPGLSLDPATGEISGTPTARSAAADYTITATNEGGSITATVNITVLYAPPTSFSYFYTAPTYTKDAAITTNYPVPTPPAFGQGLTFTGSLPAGLTLNATTGQITGTPTAVQAATPHVITATNESGSTSATVTITINYAPPTALTYTVTSPLYSLNVPITSNNPIVTGGSEGLAYSVVPPLPAGLALNTATGVITGAPLNGYPSANYTVTAANTGGSASCILSIAVEPTAPSALNYRTTAAVYTLNEPITPNVPTITGIINSWSITPGLPAGLTFNTGTGAISGTPTAIQSSIGYTVTATNSAGSTSAEIFITVDAKPPRALSYPVNPAVYTSGVAIRDNVPMVTGSVISWAVSPGLPAGLSLNGATGVISGTPAMNQAATDYTITATNGNGSTHVILSIEVNGAGPSSLLYLESSPTYSTGEIIVPNRPSVSGTVTSWSVNWPLPAGLSLDPSTGVISGRPATPQAMTEYIITATNPYGSTTTPIYITVQDGAPASLTYTSLDLVRFKPLGGAAPYYTGTASSWSITPALPAGLILNTSTGVISGTPETYSASTAYTVTATNSFGSVNSASFNIRVGVLYLYMSNTSQNSITGVPVDPSTGQLLLAETAGPYTTPGTSPRKITINPAGTYGYVPCQGSSLIARYSLNPSTGGLSFITQTSTSQYPVAMVIDPSGSYAYSVNFGADAVQAFNVMVGGALASFGSYTTLDYPLYLAINGAGTYLYVLNQLTSPSVRTYSISAGALTVVDTDSVGATPEHVAIHPSGNFLYVVNRGAGTVSAFSISAALGTLTLINTYATIATPFAIAFSGNGKYAYVTGYDTTLMGSFSVNTVTGELTYLGSQTIMGMAGNRFLTTDPGGNFLFIAKYSGGQIAVYSINKSTGALIPVNVYADPTGSGTFTAAAVILY